MRWKNKAGMVFDGVVDAMRWECEQNKTCASCRLSGEVMERNVDKLRKRYPEGFD